MNCIWRLRLGGSIDNFTILAFAGSSRENSYNENLIKEATSIAEGIGEKVTMIHLADFEAPIYQADLEKANGMPETIIKLRKIMTEHDAIMIASPEYNASIPAFLKNTLDWVSRGEKGGYSPECYKDKIFAIMSASPGQGGGQRGLKHLSDIINSLGGKVISTQTSIGKAHEYFANENRPTNERLKQEVEELVEALRPLTSV